MSVSVTSRRPSDGYQPQPPLPHAVSPPSPHAAPTAHGAFSSSPHSASHQPSPQRRPSKPLEEHKQAEPPLVSRMSTSTVSSNSPSVSSSVHPLQQYSHPVQDTSHHAVVSFAPLPAITVVRSSQYQPAPLSLDNRHNATNVTIAASTASHSSSNSYLPASHQPHPHSDTEEEDEEGVEGLEGEDEGEYEDEEESVDDSPRDGRVLTFADEHGVQLCAFYVYDPIAVNNVTPRADKQSGPGSGSGGGESERRKEIGKVARVERPDVESGCQCCIS